MDDRIHGERRRRCGFKSLEVLDRHPHVRRDLELARSLGLTLHQFDRLTESERDLWVAEWQQKKQTCSHCGNRFEECSDPNRPWYGYRVVCYASMEAAANDARYADLHEAAPYHDGTFTSWHKERSDSHPYHYNDGVTLGVDKVDHAPHDKFTTERDASPIRSVAEQSPGDEDE